MEIGHIPLVPDGPLDGAGNPGTLESVASRLAIASASAAAAYRGQAPNLLKDAGTCLTDIRSGAIADAVKAGDESVEQIVKHACYYLGMTVVTVVHLMAPDVIVFGGGLIEAMPKVMLPTIERIARKRVLDTFQDMFEIREAELGDDAAVMGAAALAQQLVERTVKVTLTIPQPWLTPNVIVETETDPPYQVAVIDIGASSLRMQIARNPSRFRQHPQTGVILSGSQHRPGFVCQSVH